MLTDRLLFVDAEFTGEHQKTTLVSLALVGLDEESILVTFNDYDRDQVTPWLEENVLAHVDASRSVSSAEGFRRIAEFVEAYSAGERVSLVSAGKLTDLILLFELWHHAHPERKYFHNLYCLPPSLNHAAHFDLNTMLYLAGVDPGVDRAEFAGVTGPRKRHDALWDARVVRACFFKLHDPKNFPGLAR
ncbi:MAG: hypothetical protein KIS78_10415 [Labilithrix sp.]|nr:hypothetical protein [Labilithrix sp.]MCW5832812.1 hypothetical protein [Labilithrix sp.]